MLARGDVGLPFAHTTDNQLATRILTWARLSVSAVLLGGKSDLMMACWARLRSWQSLAIKLSCAPMQAERDIISALRNSSQALTTCTDEVMSDEHGHLVLP